jgi:hypothetical protein
MSWNHSGNQPEVSIDLPGELSGEFVFAGKHQPIHPGKNRIQLNDAP